MDKLSDFPNLNAGGTPGHDGSNAGTTPNWLRREAREGLAEYLARLRGMSGKEDMTIGEAAKGADVMGKYGLGEKRFDMSDNEMLGEVNRFTAVWFQQAGTPERYDAWLADLTSHFRAIEGR